MGAQTTQAGRPIPDRYAAGLQRLPLPRFLERACRIPRTCPTIPVHVRSPYRHPEGPSGLPHDSVT